MATPGIAIPGTVVGSGSLVSSSGAQGIQGIQGPTAVSSDAGNLATLGSDNLILVPQSQIWSVRLRSFNAMGNPNFEVDQRTAGTGSAGSGTFAQDRWWWNNTNPTSSWTNKQIDASPGGIVIPGTNFVITSKFLRFNLGAQAVSLNPTDRTILAHYAEGSALRELIGDVTSISILARSSVANVAFGLALQDVAQAHSLTKLVTLGAANTWRLTQLPNIPVWTPSATWSINPGTQGYYLFVTLAAGTSMTAPANDTWQNGMFFGAVGQGNFSANTVGSTLDIAFIQHEPGAVCTQLMDLPFSGPNGNLEACERYFQKSYSYPTKPGSAATTGQITSVTLAASGIYSPFRYKKTMAKAPTITIYSPQNGAVNTVWDAFAAGPRTVSAVNNVGDDGFDSISMTTTNASNTLHQFHYTADTGW